MRTISFAPLLLVLAALISAETSTMVSKGEQLRIRAEPHLSSQVIGHLQKGDKVTSIQKTTFTVRVSGLEGPWHYIVSSSGARGWTFGGYLQASPDSAILQDDEIVRLMESGKLDAALALAEESLKLSKRSKYSIEDSLKYLNILMRLHEMRGEKESVAECLREALKITRASFGEKNLRVLPLLVALGRYSPADAKASLREAVGMADSSPDILGRLMVYQECASSLEALGDAGGAEDCYLKMMPLMHRAITSDSGSMVDVPQRLAALRMEAFDFPSSELFHFRALTRHSFNSAGPTDALLQELVEVSRMLMRESKINDARPFVHRAMALVSEKAGIEGSPYRAKILEYNGRLLWNDGRFKEAASAVSQAVDAYGHVEAKYLQAVGVFLTARIERTGGDRRAGMAGLEKASELFGQTRFHNMAHRLFFYDEMAAAMTEDGRYDDALALLQKISAWRKEAYGGDHFYNELSLAPMAKLYLKMERHQEAARALGELDALRSRHFGSAHPYALQAGGKGPKDFDVKSPPFLSGDQLVLNVGLVEEAVAFESLFRNLKGSPKERENFIRRQWEASIRFFGACSPQTYYLARRFSDHFQASRQWAAADAMNQWSIAYCEEGKNK